MNPLGLLAGFTGGVAQGQIREQQLTDDRNARFEQEKSLAQLREEMEIRKEDRLRAQRDIDLKNPDSEASVKLRGSKAEADSKELGLLKMKTLMAEDDVQAGRDTQLPDGSFIVVGSDGKARHVAKDGTLLDSKGVDASTYGMDGKERASIAASNASAASANARTALTGLEIDEQRDAKTRREKVRGLVKKFNIAKTQGANADMLRMIDDDIVANGGKSMMPATPMQEVETVTGSKETDLSGKPLTTTTIKRKEPVQAKTATAAEIEAYAKAKGISPSDVRAKLIAEGYRVL